MSEKPSFRVEIANLGILLGKSPVTLRNWERKGIVSLTRVGVNRSCAPEDVVFTARRAYDAGRISEDRLVMVTEAMSLISALEVLEDTE